MTLTFEKCFYPGHARSPKFYLGAAPWPRGCSACPGLLLGFTWDCTRLKNTQCFLCDTESGHLFPKVFSSHWAKQNVFRRWFSALHWVHWVNKLRTEKNLKPQPIWKSTTKFLTESSKQKCKNSQCWVQLQPGNTGWGLKNRFLSQIQHCQKRQKKWFSLTPHHVIASNSFGGPFWRGPKDPSAPPRKFLFLLIIKEQISKAFSFFNQKLWLLCMQKDLYLFYSILLSHFRIFHIISIFKIFQSAFREKLFAFTSASLRRYSLYLWRKKFFFLLFSKQLHCSGAPAIQALTDFFCCWPQIGKF